MARRKPARRFPPEVLNDAEVRALLHACGNRTLPERRNRALLVLL
jgi:site-specific recombinase XerD